MSGLEERDLPLHGLWPQEIKKFKLRRDKMCYVQNNSCSVLLLPGHSGPPNSPAAVTRVSVLRDLPSGQARKVNVSSQGTFFLLLALQGGKRWKITN